MGFWSVIIKGDRRLWGIIAALIFSSLVIMASASSQIAFKSEHLYDPFASHFLFLTAGVIVMFVTSNIPYRFLRIMTYPIVFVSFILLALTPLIGTEINGAVRSINIFGFEFQPLELGKFSVVLLISDILSRYQNDERFGGKYFWIMTAAIIAFCGLIAYQNLSTAIMLFLVAFALMLIGRVKFSQLLQLGGVLAVLLLIFFFLIKVFPDAVPDRMVTWGNRIEDFATEMTADKNDADRYRITDDNRQIMNSKIAIANGISPSGPGNSEQRDYLPLAFSDFIFAVIVEEYGILGAVFTIALYSGILFIGGQIARNCDRAYPALLVTGLSILIVLQAMISMAVTVQLGPVTGQPLPLISRGGTSILVTSAYLGIILSISQYTRELRKPSIVIDINGTAADSTTVHATTTDTIAE